MHTPDARLPAVVRAHLAVITVLKLKGPDIAGDCPVAISIRSRISPLIGRRTGHIIPGVDRRTAREKRVSLRGAAIVLQRAEERIDS